MFYGCKNSERLYIIVCVLGVQDSEKSCVIVYVLGEYRESVVMYNSMCFRGTNKVCGHV